MKRWIRGAALLTAATVTFSGTSAMASTESHLSGRFDRPQRDFAPAWTTLRDGSPSSAGLDPAPIKAAERFLES